MKELKEINARIGRKQFVRSIAGSVSIILGMILMGKYTYQKGITDGQRAIRNEFPEEYASITAKICEAFEKN